MDAPSAPISTWQYTTPDGEVRALVAWGRFWRRAFNYTGRATRAEYNWALTQFLVVGLVASALIYTMVPRDTVRTVLDAGVWALFIVPWIALICRRCHDLNRRGTFGLWLLATNIGFLVTEGFLIFGPSDPRGVRFDLTPPTVGPGSAEPVEHSDLSG